MTSMRGSGSAWPNLTVWHLNSLVVVVIVGGVAVLIARWRFVQFRERRTVAIGIASLALLLASDIQTLAMTSYRCHMIEHIVIVTLVAPIFAASVHWPLSKSTATLGFLAFTLVVPLYHVTRLGGLVMSHSYGHVLELATFLVIGIWFWAPVYGARQMMSPLMRTCYVALAVPIIVTTGLVLWSSSRSYLESVNMNMAGITISDIHEGGLVMMLLGTVTMLGHVMGLAILALRQSLRSQEPLGRLVRVQTVARP
jgi:cytochrome c oxidase assembly factor CtaG